MVQDFDHTIIKNDVDAIIDFSYRERENQSDMDKYFPNSVTLGGAAAFVQIREGHDFMQKEKDVQRYFQEFWPRDKDDFFQFDPVLLPLDNLYFSGCNYSGSIVLGNYKLVSILAAVALVILLFSIMNYVNLTVAQSGYRAREMATRRLFGCTKRHRRGPGLRIRALHGAAARNVNQPQAAGKPWRLGRNSSVCARG